MKKLAVIPSRYASTRFEGKPLAKILDKPMVVWVYQAVKSSGLFDKVLVATDDMRIYNVVKDWQGEAIMTSDGLKNGTQRCHAVLQESEQAGETYDVVVNIQGDEPLIKKEMMQAVVDGFENPDADIVTLKKSIEDIAQADDPNVVKVVTAVDGTALYFSRSRIPFARTVSTEELVRKGLLFKHIGIYGYRSDVLKRITGLKESFLQHSESLEQLNWLENGYKIIVKRTDFDTVGVDTPEDLLKINEILAHK